MFEDRDGLDHRLEPSAEVDRVAKVVVDAAIEVHRHLGPGFLESVYEDALCVELALRGIRFQRQLPFAVTYKGHDVGEGRIDLLVEDCLIVELKTIDCFAPVHRAQAISYLIALRKQVALLINFNVPLLKEGLKRIVRST